MKRIAATTLGVVPVFLGVILMLVPGTAVASSTCEAYNPQQSCTPSLPFTGLDLGLLIGGGALLVAAGIIARIVVSHRSA